MLPISEKNKTQCKLKVKNLKINECPIIDCNNISDHTPTPTRFIRNCEEVGLFQDLINVNPFEEGFRKALTGLASNKQGETTVSQVNSSSSLDTPVILPHTVSSCSITGCGNKTDIINGSKLNEDTDSTNKKCSSEKSLMCIGVSRKQRKKSINIHDINTPYNERRREMNRLAAQRCRLRQRLIVDQQQDELIRLRDENETLRLCNHELRMEVKSLLRQVRILQASVPQRIVLPSTQSHNTIQETPIINTGSPFKEVIMTDVRSLNPAISSAAHTTDSSLKPT